MTNIAAFECINITLQKITGRGDIPFGGKTIIVIGDFRQVAPVVPNGSPAEVLLASIKSSNLWQEFEAMRYGSDPELCDFVDAVGNGIHAPTATPSLFDRITTVEDAVDFLFPPDVRMDPTRSVNRAFLTPRNSLVDEFNSHMLHLLDHNEGKQFQIPSTTTLTRQACQSCTTAETKYERPIVAS
jgi:ATP-dependent DNA helicase PIF1